jgi:hypothetical protein
MRWSIFCGVALAVAAPGLAGQGLPGAGVDLGLTAGFFGDYPSEFTDGSCESLMAGITGSAARVMRSVLALEASATLSFESGTMSCVDALLPAPVDGQPFSRRLSDDPLVGPSFFATNVAAVVDPLSSRVGPRVRVGVGRLWDRKVNNWFYGAGLRVRVAGDAIVFDVSRWNLTVDVRRELLIYRDSGAHEFVRIDTFHESPRPFLFSVGWQRSIR